MILMVTGFAQPMRRPCIPFCQKRPRIEGPRGLGAREANEPANLHGPLLLGGFTQCPFVLSASRRSRVLPYSPHVPAPLRLTHRRARNWLHTSFGLAGRSCASVTQVKAARPATVGFPRRRRSDRSYTLVPTMAATSTSTPRAAITNSLSES